MTYNSLLNSPYDYASKESYKPSIDSNQALSNDYISTFGFSDPTKDYFSMDWNKSINVNRKSKDVLLQIKNKAIQQIATKILLIFQDLVKRYADVNGYLPPLMLNNLDDGSLLIEWNFAAIKIGFQIENRIEESSWFVVASSSAKSMTESGCLDLNDLEDIISKLYETAQYYKI